MPNVPIHVESLCSLILHIYLWKSNEDYLQQVYKTKYIAKHRGAIDYKVITSGPDMPTGASEEGQKNPCLIMSKVSNRMPLERHLGDWTAPLEPQHSLFQKQLQHDLMSRSAPLKSAGEGKPWELGFSEGAPSAAATAATTAQEK